MPEKQNNEVFAGATQSEQPGEDPHIDDEQNEQTSDEYVITDALVAIAGRLGVPADLARILNQIDEKINTALRLEENLRKVASRLGVPDTVGHITQRIEEMEFAQKEAFEIGLSAGQAEQKLEYEHIRILAKQVKLRELQDDWAGQKKALADHIEKQREQ